MSTQHNDDRITKPDVIMRETLSILREIQGVLEEVAHYMDVDYIDRALDNLEKLIEESEVIQ